MLKQVGGTTRPLDTRWSKGSLPLLQAKQGGTITCHECNVRRHHDIPIIREAWRNVGHQSLSHVSDSSFSAVVANRQLPGVKMRNCALADRQLLVLLQVDFDHVDGGSVVATR